MRTTTHAALAALAVGVSAAQGIAQVTVWVDFTSDLHNGLTGGPNGKPDWVDELDKATASAGVTTFTSVERSAIEGAVLAQLGTIYSGYSVTFTTAMPGSGMFDAIAYGKNSFGFSSLGIAPVDPANIGSGQVGGIATGNFDFILDEFVGSASRSTQIAQISTALAGTGAHELGHTFGLMHHHAYSDPSITPASYAATGGVQNGYVIATADTGLTEAGREVLRTLSPWERAMLDLAGGASMAFTGPSFAHQKLVSTPVPINLMEDGPFDAGGTIPTAMPVMFTTGESSGMSLALVAADLDGSAADTDVYGFMLTAPSRLTAEIFSSNRFASPFNFDAAFELLDSSGALIFANDDVLYDGDIYDAGVFQQNDPYLLNIPDLAPGAYFLRVHDSMAPSIPAAAGDAYWLMIGATTIPEPAACSTICIAALLRRRRHRAA
jgi:hypothetical protein